MEVESAFLQTNDKLESMITVYKSQLKQIESVLPGATDEQRIELETLVKTMNELIADARNNQSEAEHWYGHLNETHPTESNANLRPENPTLTHTETLSKISEQWEGKQCQAPFQQLSGLTGYHNAIVIQIEPDPSPQNEIFVQVAYSNPICPKMRPCPFYLEGKCRFSDIKCRYSHGQLVKLNSLKEYKEPDFTLVQPGARVLAKSFQDELWYSGFVSSKLANQTFKIMLDNSEIPLEISLQFILPMNNKEEENNSLGTDDDEDKETESAPDYEFGAPNRLGWAYSQFLDQQTLGEWEKHTKGIGSKLMTKMGYKTGQGLGKECQGRLNPVDAMVLPSGRSLDHCMELKEQAMDEDLLKVEKRLARAKAKEERRLQQLSERSDEKPALTSIFDFMNATLGTAKTETEANPIPSTSKTKSIKKVSTQKLNLQGFQLAESIRKAEKDLSHYRSSLQRQQLRGDARLVQQTRQKIANKEHEIEKLKVSEISVAKEQNLRKSSSKLSIF